MMNCKRLLVRAYWNRCSTFSHINAPLVCRSAIRIVRTTAESLSKRRSVFIGNKEQFQKYTFLLTMAALKCSLFGRITKPFRLTIVILIISIFVCFFLLFLLSSLSIILRFQVVAVILACVGVLTATKSDQAISAPKHVDCERQCPYYYYPICATNGNPDENRMFVNYCEMQAWNCDAKKSKHRPKRHF